MLPAVPELERVKVERRGCWRLRDRYLGGRDRYSSEARCPFYRAARPLRPAAGHWRTRKEDTIMQLTQSELLNAYRQMRMIRDF
jgi:hypothetical protein